MEERRALVFTAAVTGVVRRKKWREEQQLIILRTEAYKSVTGRDSCARRDWM